MTAFIPLPERYAAWFKERAWSRISVAEVTSLEPAWRVYAKVPAEGWSFNYSMGEPGWRKLPEMPL